MNTTLYLVRHCQSQPAADLSDSDWPLSERGVRQARELVPILEALDVDELYSSPYSRCLGTLGPSAAHLGLTIRTDPDLRERLISRKWLSDFRDVWRRSWEDLSFRLDGGESSHECRQRVMAAIDRIVANHRGRTLAIGSHGNALSLFLSAFTPGYGIEEASALRNPELLKVTHGDAGYVWEWHFELPDAFHQLATDFRETPGIIAG